MSFIRRASTQANTWTIDDGLFEEVISTPNAKLVVINNKGKEVIYTQIEVIKMWNQKGYLSSSTNYPIRVMYFPWHGLYQAINPNT